jgi:hypothetical protein
MKNLSIIIRRLTLSALLFAISSYAAHAQISNSFIGKWEVRWQGEKREIKARLQINETGGEWQTAANLKTNHCIGMKTPVIILSSSADEMEIKLHGSSVIPGCEDYIIQLKRIDEKNLSGASPTTQFVIRRE